MIPTINGEFLRSTLDEEQNGVYLLAAHLPAEGLALLKVEVAGKSSEIPAAPKLLFGKLKFPYLPSARRYFAAFPFLALALLTRL